MKRPVNRGSRLVAYLDAMQTRGNSLAEVAEQRQAVEDLVKRSGAKVIAEYLEDSSENEAHFACLRQAIELVQQTKQGLLVIPNVTGRVALLEYLRDTRVPFIACDDPCANELTVELKIGEAMLRSHSRAATQSDASRHGTDRPTQKSSQSRDWLAGEMQRLLELTQARHDARESHRKTAEEEYAELLPIIKELHQRGETARQIAQRLNKMGFTNRLGKAWSAAHVSRLLKDTPARS